MMSKEQREALTWTVANALEMVPVNLDELELESLSDEDVAAITRGRLVTAAEASEIANSLGCAAEDTHMWEYEIDKHLRWLREPEGGTAMTREKQEALTAWTKNALPMLQERLGVNYAANGEACVDLQAVVRGERDASLEQACLVADALAERTDVCGEYMRRISDMLERWPELETR